MNDLDNLAAQVEANPNDVTLCLVFADCVEEQGWAQSAEYIRKNGCRVRIGVGDGGVGDGGVGDGGVAVGDGGGGGGVGDGGGGVGDGGGGVGGDGGVGDGGDGGVGGVGGGGVGDGVFTRRWAVVNGLYILSVQGGYYPYVIIGWVERCDFLLRVRNSRIIRRFGRNGQLSQMAKNGPIKGSNPTQLLELSIEEWVPLASISRAISADPLKWSMCPEPK